MVSHFTLYISHFIIYNFCWMIVNFNVSGICNSKKSTIYTPTLASWQNDMQNFRCSKITKISFSSSVAGFVFRLSYNFTLLVKYHEVTKWPLPLWWMWMVWSCWFGVKYWNFFANKEHSSIHYSITYLVVIC